MTKQPLTSGQIQEICEAIPINRSLPEHIRLSISSRIRTRLYNDLCRVQIYPQLFSTFKEEIVKYYYKTLAPSGEAVGVQVAQSIGERQTQNTLNSIDWEDKIILTQNGECIVEPVGKFIDEFLEKEKEKVEYIEENRTQYLDLSSLSYDVKMPSVDENGHTEWLKVEALTRHLPVGKLVKVKTHFGREVTATQSKSFLVWDSSVEKFIDKNGSDLKVGDYLPTTSNLSRVGNEMYLNLQTFFPKTKYLYTTELNKAKRIREENPRGWWKDYNGKEYTLPYNRADSVFLRKENMEMEDGFVFLHRSTRFVSSIPEKIPLDEDFGFFIGIYLAKGWCTKTFTGISNNCPIIRKRVTDWCDRYGITYHLVVSNGKNVRTESISSDLKIHSVLITSLLMKICKTGSSQKIVPSFAFVANKNFQQGMIDGYFSGDGTVNKEDGSIIASSCSKELIHGISFILYYFGVVGRVSESQAISNNVGSKNIKKSYVLRISNGFSQTFAHNISLTEQNKQEKLSNITLSKNFRCLRGRNQKTFPITDVVFDQIVSIDYVEPTKEYVYDFTVEKTRNFIIFNGLGVRDTFHSSGLSIKTVVVGVPRFSELLNATRSPKMVNCLLYLNEPFDDVSHVRRRSGNMFTDMTIRRLLKSSELIKDEPLEAWHHLFCDLYEVNRGILGWRLRLHIDKDVLYEYQVTTKMIAQSIMNEYVDAIVLHTPDWVGIIDVFVDEGCFTKLEKEKEKVEKEKLEKENTEEEEAEEEEDEEDEEDDDGDVEVGVEDNGDDKDGDEKDEDIKDIRDKDTELPIPIRKNDDGKKDVIPDDIDRVIHMEDKVLPSILDIRVCGVEGVKDIFFEKRKEEWIITTEGSNLYNLFANPLIDKTRSMSNDMWEIYEIFGIEAARQFLIEEYMDIVSSDGTFVNASNVELLVDIMVYTGTIISISRYGQKKVGCGPMAKASFEESLENFLKAGVNGEKESANGVSASIMLGKMPNIGTGVFDLLVDVPKLLEMNMKEETVEKEIKEVKEEKKEIKHKISVEKTPEIPSKSIFQKF